MVMEGNFQQLLECPVDSFSFHIDLVLSGIQILHLSILQPDKKNHNTEQSQQKNVSTGYFQLKYRKKRLHTGTRNLDLKQIIIACYYIFYCTDDNLYNPDT